MQNPIKVYKKIKADQKHWLEKIDKLEAKLDNCTDTADRKYYQERIVKCEDHLSEAYSKELEFWAKAITAGGLLAGTIGTVAIKAVRDETRYRRARVYDQTQMDIDHIDPENRRSTYS